MAAKIKTSVNKKLVDWYVRFHGVEPAVITAGRLWVPGTMYKVGRAIDIGYGIIDRRSSKGPHVYVHQFGTGVNLYTRVPNGSRQAKKSYKTFPKTLMVLGDWVGTSAVLENTTVETPGSTAYRLCVTPDGRRLVAVHRRHGVVALWFGGKMRVTDWIRN